MARRRNEPESSVVRRTAPIVPRDTVTGRALLSVIAIMTFVAALIVGAISVVADNVSAWRNDMARELTIQLRPLPGREIAVEIGKAIDIARRTNGIADARAVTRDEAGRLLEPWLGSGVDFNLLPIPRLVVVQLAENVEPDLMTLRRELSEQVAGASLDDHRAWSGRLAAVSELIIFTGFILLSLVLTATVLSVSFATRGAVSANRAIVEVLHLVGARDDLIASTFQRHFFAVGAQGGLIGGMAAAALFALGAFLPELLSRMPGGDQAASLTGQFVLDRHGYIGITGVIALVAIVTALASRLTVRRTLHQID
jgi:cell division transport system permease protein